MIFFLVLFSVATFAYCDAWYNSAWPYRQDLSIAASGASATVNNFPVLIHLDQANDPLVFADAKSNFNDLVFTANDGTTVLPYEIEGYSSTDLWIWVKLPSYYTATSASVGGNNHIYMYYGNPAATDQSNKTAVWDSNYAFVHHMNLSGSTLYDSTANAVNGTKNNTSVGSWSTGSALPIMNDQVFNGTGSQYISLNNVVTAGWTAFSFSGWVNFTQASDGNYARIFAQAYGLSPNTVIGLLAYDNTGDLNIVINSNYTSFGVSLPNTTWTHVAVTWNGTNATLYMQPLGGALTTATVAMAYAPIASPGASNEFFLFGNACTDSSTPRPFNGPIDEFRFSDSVRSSDWFTAEYTNQSTGTTPLPSGSITTQAFVGGHVYSDEGSTPLAGATVNVLVNGTSVGTTTSDSNGAWGLGISTSSVATGDKITAFINATAPNGGAAVTTYGGSNLYNLDIYKGEVIVRNDNGGNPAVGDLQGALATYTNLPYDSSTTPVSIVSGYSLYVPSGVTFVPGANFSIGTSGTSSGLRLFGTVTPAANTFAVYGSVSGTGTLTAGSGAITVAGSFAPGAYSDVSGSSLTVGGNFTPTTYTTAAGAITQNGTGSIGSYTFYDLTLSGTGTHTASGAWTVTNALALSGGTFDPGSYTHTIAGSWNDSAVTFRPTSGTIVLTSATSLQSTVTLGSNYFYNLSLSPAASTTTTMASGVTVNGNLTIGSNATFNAGAGSYTLQVGGNWTNSGAFSYGTASTVSFINAATTSTITGNNTFYNLSVPAGAAGKTINFAATTQTIASGGSLNVTGSSSALTSLSGTGWNLDWAGSVSATVSYAEVDHSTASALTTATNSVDGGSNTNWSFAGTTYTWSGATDSSWSTAANWSGAAVPTVSSLVNVPGSLATYPTVSASTATSLTLSIASGASVTVTAGTLGVSSLTNQGTIYRYNSSLASISATDAVHGTVVYQGTGGAIQDHGSSDYANLTIDSYGQTFTLGASLHVTGNLTINAGSLDLSGFALVVDGNLTINSTGALTNSGSATTVSVGGSVSATGSIDATNLSTISVGGSWSVSSFVPGTSTVSFSGTGTIAATSFSNLTIASSGSATLTGGVSASGALTVNGSLGEGSYTLSVTGAISGTGALSQGSGTLTANGALSVSSFSMGSGTAYLAGGFSPTSFSAGSGTVIFNGNSTLGASYTFNNLTVATGATLQTYPSLGTITSTIIGGGFANKGTLDRQGGDYVSKTDAVEGTVSYLGTTGTIQSYGGSNDYYNLTVDASGYTLALAGSVTVNGNLSLAAGTLAASSYTIQLAGNFSNSGGAFTSGTGTVELVNASLTSTISGANTFYNLTCTVPGKTITFPAGVTTGVTGAFTVTGTAVNHVVLTNSSTWTISATGATAVNYATVAYSTASTGITAYASTDGGNNSGWTFSGSNYLWVGTTTNWSTLSNWSVNGSTPAVLPGGSTNDVVVIQSGYTSPQIAAGTYISGSPLTIGSLTIDSGATLDVTNNYITITSAFTNRGTLKRYLQSGPITNTVSATDYSEGTVEYEAGVSPGYVQDYGSQDYYNLTIDSGLTVNLNYNLGVNGTLANAGTINASSTTVSVGGNWTNTSTFNAGTGTVIFANAAQTTVVSGTNTFNNFSIVTPGKLVQFPTGSGSATTVSGTLTLTGSSASPVYLRSVSSGTQWYFAPASSTTVNYVDVEDSYVSSATAVVLTANSSTDSGNNSSSGSPGSGGGYWSFSATGTYAVWSTGAGSTTWTNSANWQSGNVPTTGSGYTVVIPAGASFYPALSGNMSLTNLTIQSGASINIGTYTMTVSGTYANAGTLYRSGGSSMNVTDTSEGTVVYQGASGSIQDYGSGNDYYNLTIGDGATSLSYTTSAALKVAGALNVTANATLSAGSYALTVSGATTVDGTLTGGSGAITLGGAVSGGGGFTASSGTTTVSASFQPGVFTANGGTFVAAGTGTINSYTFNNLTVSASGSTVALGGAETVNGNLTLSAGTLNLAGYTLSLGGNLTATSGSFNSGTSGTVAFITAATTSVVGSSITYPNLSIATAGKNMEFLAGSTQTVSGTLTLTGGAGSPVTLASTAASAWTLVLSSAAATASYVSVSYSTMSGSYGVTANDSVDGGNNTTTSTPASAPGWYFPRPTSYTWTGGAGTTAWTTPGNWAEGNGSYYPGSSGTSDTVTLPSSATYWPALSSGETISSITLPSGAQLTLDAALTVTTVTNAGTITINSGGTMNSNDSADGGTVVLTAASALATYSYANLHLAGAQSYAPTATLTVVNGLTVDTGSTLNLSTYALSVGGTLTNQGTIQLAGSQTVTLSGGNDVSEGLWQYTLASGSTTVKDFGATDYYNVSFTGGATYNLGAALAAAGTITIASGTTLSLAGNSVSGTVASKNANATLELYGSESVSPASLLSAGITDYVGTGASYTVSNGTYTTLIINSATAAYTFSSALTVGSSITVTNSNGVTFQAAVSVPTLTLTNSVASTTIAFQGNLNVTTGMSAAAGSGYAVSLTGASNSIAAATTFLNTGAVTLGQASGTTTFTGGITTTGSATNPSGVTLNGTLYTNGAAVALGPLTLGSAAVIDTTNGGGVTAGAAIGVTTLGGGGFTLGLNGGTGGAVTVSGAVDNISTLTVTNSNGVTFGSTYGATTPGAVTIPATQQGGVTVAFTGSTKITTLTTANSGYNVSITGAANTVSNAATLNNTGSLTLGTSGSTTAFMNGAAVGATTPTALNIAGTVSAAAGVLNFGTVPVTVTANATVGGTSTGQITLGAITIDDGYTLTLGAAAATPVSFGAISSAAYVAGANLALDTSGTVTVGGSVTLSGTLTVTLGTLPMGTYGLSVAGSTTIDGTLNGGSGTDSFAAVGGGGAFNASTGSTTISGDLTVTAFAPDGGSVTFTGGTQGAYSFYDVAIGGAVSASGSWTIGNNLTISSGSWTAGAYSHSVGGNWTNSVGTSGFVGTGSTIDFTGVVTHTISGATNFNNLSDTVGGSTLSFTAGETFGVGGLLTLQGSAGNLLAIESSVGGSTWSLNNSGGTNSVSYVAVSDSPATATVTATDSQDLTGNNTNWNFGAITWTGTTSTDANLGSNWSSGVVPGQYDAVAVPSAPANQPVQSAALSLKGLTVQLGASWSNGGFNLGLGTGSLTNAGSFTYTGAGTLSGLPASVGGTFIYSGGTSISMIAGVTTYGNLTVSGGTITAIAVTVSGTFTVSGGNLTVPNAVTLTLNGATNQVTGGTLTISTGGSVAGGTNAFTVGSLGTLDTSGTLTVGDFTSSGTITNSGVNTINASGNVGIGGAFSGTLSDSTIQMSGSGTIDTGVPIGNLAVMSGSTPTVTVLGSALNVAGTLTVNNSTTLTDATNNLGMTVAGSTTIDGRLDGGGGTDSFAAVGGSGGTFNASTGSTTISGGMGSGLTFAHDNGSVTLTGGTIAATYDFYDLTVSTGSVTLSSGLTAANTFDLASGGTLVEGSGAITLNGASNTFAGTFTKNGSGSIVFSGGIAQTLTAGGEDLGNATVSGSGTVVTIGNQTVTFDALSTASSGELDLDATAGSVTVQLNSGQTLSNGGAVKVLGTTTNSATIAAASGTATFSGSDVTWTNGQTLTLSSILYGPALNLGTTTAVVKLGDGADTFTSVTVGTGTFDANGQTWTMSGSWDNSSTGALVGATAAASFTGTAQTINSGGTGTSPNKVFGPVVVNGTYSLSGNAASVGSLSGTGTLTTNGQALTVGGNLTIADLTATGSEAIAVGGNFQPGTAFTCATSAVTLSGSGVTLTPAGDFYDLAVNGTVTTLGGALTTLRDLSIGASGGLAAGANTITVGRNWTNGAGASGFTAGTGTVSFDTTQTSHTISGSTTFYNLSVDASTAAAQVTINFPAYPGDSQIIAAGGTLTLKGKSSQLLVLTGASNWAINFQGATQSISYVQASYANALSSDITATTSANYASNNLAGTGYSWVFGASTLTWTGATSGNWNTATNWNYGYVPNATDLAVIPSTGVTTTLDIGGLTTTTQITGLTINGTVDASTAGSLGVLGSLTVGNTAVIGTPGNTTWVMSGSGTSVSSSIATSIGNLTVEPGAGNAVSLGSAVSVSGLTLTSGTLAETGSGLNVAGNITRTSGVITSSGTVTLDGTAAAQVVDFGGSTLTNLVVDNTSGTPTVTASNNGITLGGNLTLTSGTLALGGLALNVAGNISRGSGAIDSSGTVTLDGSGAQSVDFTGSTLGNLTVTNASASGVTLTAATTSVGGALSVNTASAYLLTGGTNLTVSGAADFTNGKLDLGSGGTFTVGGSLSFGTVTSASGSTLVLDGSSAQAIVPNGQTVDTVQMTGSGGVSLTGSATFGSLSVSGGEIFTLGGAATTSLTVSGALANSGVVDLSSTASGAPTTLTMGSGTTITNSGTLAVTNSTGTVTLTSSGAGTTLTGTALSLGSNSLSLGYFTTAVAHTLGASAQVTLVGPATFSGGLTLNGAGSAVTTGSNVLSPSGGLTITNGTVNVTGSGSINAGSAAIGIGTSGTLVLNSSASPTVQCGDVSSSGTITNTAANTVAASGNVTIGGTFGTPSNSTITMSGAGTAIDATVQIGSLSVPSGATVNVSTNALDLAGSLTVTSTGSVSLGGMGLTVGGSVSGTGSLAATGSEAISVAGGWSIGSFTPVTSQVTFGGGTVSAGAYSFYDVVISQAVTLGANLGVLHDLTINATTGSLAGSTYTVTVGRNWTNNRGALGYSGTGTGTVAFDDNTQVSAISGTTSFNNFSCTTLGKTLAFQAGSGNISAIGGNFTITGSSGGIGNLITLESQTVGSQWYFSVAGTKSVSYAVVSDSNYSVPSITASNSSNATNNTNWIFSASTLTWTGATSGNWNTATNWNYGYVPNATDLAVIPSTGVTTTLDIGGLTTTTQITGLTINGTVDASTAGSLGVLGSLTVGNTAVIGTPGNTTWVMSGSGTSVSSSIATSIGNLTVEPGAGNAVSLGSAVSVSGLTLTSGTLAETGSGLNVAGNITRTSGVITSSGTVTLDGTAAAQVVDFGGSTLTNLVVDNTSGTPTVTASNNGITLGGNLTLTSGTLALGGLALNVAGNISRGSGAIDSSGTVTLDGSGAQSVDTTSSTLANVTIATRAAGTVTFTGPLNASGTLSVAGGAYGVTLQAGGTVANAVTFNNTGALTIPAGFTFTNGVTATAPTSKSVAGTIQSTNSPLDFGTTAVTLSGAATFNGGSGAITLAAVSGGGNSLYLSGSGADSVAGATLGAGSFDTSGMTGGSVTVTGALSATALVTGSASYAMTLAGGGTVTNAVTFNNTGTLAITSGFTFTNGASATAPSSKSVAGTIQSTNSPLDFGTTPVTLSGAATFNGGSGAITLGAVSGGGNNLLLGGSGSDTVASAVLGAGTFDTTGMSGGSVAVNGALSAAGLTTASAAYGLSLLGGATIVNATTLQITGALTLGNATGDLLLFAGGLTATSGASPFDLYATIETGGAPAALGPVTLAGNSIIDTTQAGTFTAGGNITLGNVTGGTYELDVRSGTSGTFAQSAGTITAGSLNVVTGGSIGAAGTPVVTNVSDLEAQSSGLINVSNAGALTIGYAAASFDVSGLSTSNANITVSAGGTITVAEPINAGTGIVTLTSPNLVITAAAPAIVANGGIDLQPSAAATSIGINDSTGTYQISTAELQALQSTGTVTLGGATGTGTIYVGLNGPIDLSATGYDLSLQAASSAVQFDLTGSNSLSLKNSGTLTITTGGAITSPGGSTKDVAIGGSGILSLAAGIGSVGTVSTPLTTQIGVLRASGTGNLYVNEVGAIQLGDGTGGVTTSGGTIAINAGGAMTFGAAVTTSGGATPTISLSGTSISLSQNVAAAASSQISLTASGGSISTTGGTVGAAGSTSLLVMNASGAIGASGSPIQTDVGTLRATASGGGVFVNDASALQLGDSTAGITASGGNVAITTTSGAITVANKVQTTTANSVDLTTGSGSIVVTSTSSPVVSTPGGAISFNSPVVIAVATAISSGAGGVTFQSTVDDQTAGADSLVIDSGGLTTFAGAVGSGTPLGALTTDSAGTNAINGGAVTTTGAQSYGGAVSLGANTAIATSGGAVDFASTVDGATAGGESLTVNAGTVSGTVTFGGAVGANTALASLNVTSTAGAANAITIEGVRTSGTQSYTGNVSLGADATLTTTNSNVSFSNTINGAHILSVALGSGSSAGSLTVSGIIGATTPLTGFNVTGASNVSLSGIGSGAQGVTGSVSVTAATQITLSGLGTPNDYWSGGPQSYDGGTNGTEVSLGGDGTLSGGGSGITFANLSILSPGHILTLGSNLTSGQIAFFQGTLDAAGHTIATSAGGTGDFLVFGSGYNATDGDQGTTSPGNTFFAYPGGPLLFDPGAGNYSAAFGDLAGSTIAVGSGGTGNFYDNGANMTGTSSWTLTIQNNANADPPANWWTTNWWWGTPYAVAFNMTVANSAVTGGAVSASAPSGGQTNNNVSADAYSSSNGWHTSIPTITSAKTVRDNVIEVTFSEAVANTNDEIARAVGQVTTNGGAVAFTGAFTDAACTTSTTGAGNLQTIYLQTTSTTWNTDATGSTAGGATSTDYSGVHSSVIPDITALKGLFFSAVGRTLSQGYGTNGLSSYTGVSDGTGPVVIKIELDRAAHSATAATTYDAHNYFHLYYSEPVNIGSSLVIGAGAPPATGQNVESEGSFTSAAQVGGAMEQNGADDVMVVGYFDYRNASGMTVGVGSADSTPVTGLNALQRPNDQELEIYFNGYSESGYPNPYWPGYSSGTTNPATATLVTIEANPYITDASGNAVDAVAVAHSLLSSSGSFTTVTSWDVDPPAFSIYNPPSGLVPGFAEVLSRDANGDGLVDTLDFHMQDNESQNNATDWLSQYSTAAQGPVQYHHTDTRAEQGIRDNSIQNATQLAAFDVGPVGGSLQPLPSAAFSTTVQENLFNPSAVTTANDSYFSLSWNESTTGWTAATDLEFTYNASVGKITDLAGNLLPSVTTAFEVIQHTPPVISIALSVAGKTKIYVKFSTPVYGPSGTSIQASDFTVSGNTVTGLQILTTVNGGAADAFLTVANPITADEELTSLITPVATGSALQPTNIRDATGNYMQASYSHPVSDIGLGIADPVWASDGLHTNSGGIGGALHLFDGSGKLLDRDITVEASIAATSAASQPLELVYDVNPPAATLVNGFWLPMHIPNFNPQADTQARVLTAFRVQNATRDFLIPSSDPAIKDGVTVEFLLRLGTLYCARVSNPDDPRTVEPFLIPIRDVVQQRSGVTILNNVVNPVKNEKTLLMYTLQSAGTVTIQVFDLAGDLVKVLHRGPQGKGSYTVSWDGRNSAGRIVARGIYFIRVVAPHIDEFRKVLIVK